MLRKRAIGLGTVRRLALALPETTESRHFDTPDIRVRHKIFVSFPDGGKVIGLKCTPANVDALVAADPETFGDLWRGRWLGVRLDRIAQPVLQELITDCMVSRRTQTPRGGAGNGGRAKGGCVGEKNSAVDSGELSGYPGVGG
jgi:Protein of unknown function (DUF419).